MMFPRARGESRRHCPILYRRHKDKNAWSYSWSVSVSSSYTAFCLYRPNQLDFRGPFLKVCQLIEVRCLYLVWTITTLSPE